MSCHIVVIVVNGRQHTIRAVDLPLVPRGVRLIDNFGSRYTALRFLVAVEPSCCEFVGPAEQRDKYQMPRSDRSSG